MLLATEEALCAMELAAKLDPFSFVTARCSWSCTIIYPYWESYM